MSWSTLCWWLEAVSHCAWFISASPHPGLESVPGPEKVLTHFSLYEQIFNANESLFLGHMLQTHGINRAVALVNKNSSCLKSCSVVSFAFVVQTLSCVLLFATPWTVALQASLCMGFSRQEYCSELPFPSPGYLPGPDMGIKPMSPALAGRFFTPEPPRKPVPEVKKTVAVSEMPSTWSVLHLHNWKEFLG